MSQFTSPYSEPFPSPVPILAPFWDDIIIDLPSAQVVVATVPGNSTLADQVDDFLSTNQSITYTTSWMVVVQWIDARFYHGPDNEVIMISTQVYDIYLLPSMFRKIHFNWC